CGSRVARRSRGLLPCRQMERWRAGQKPAQRSVGRMAWVRDKPLAPCGLKRICKCLRSGIALAKQLCVLPVSEFRLQTTAASLCLPPSRSKVLANANRVVAPPGTIGAKVGSSQIAVPCSKTVEQEVLGDPHLEAATHVHGRAPGVLDPDRIEGPSVQVLGNILAEKEVRLSPQHESAKGSSAKRSRF